jgi:hypothetical protein
LISKERNSDKERYEECLQKGKKEKGKKKEKKKKKSGGRQIV